MCPRFNRKEGSLFCVVFSGFVLVMGLNFSCFGLIEALVRHRFRLRFFHLCWGYMECDAIVKQHHTRTFLRGIGKAATVG